MTARIVLTKTTPLGSYPSLPITALAAHLTMTAADASNKNSFVASGNDLVVAWNSGAVDAHTVTITSEPDPMKRTGDITAYSIAAGLMAIFGPFKAEGWKQTDGKVWLEANHAEIKFGVIALR